MAVGIFANCVFYLKVNHLPIQDKKRLKAYIKENGGSITFVLDKKCTHVIVENVSVLGSRQLRNINNNQIPILKADFIWKCVEERLLLRTDDFCHSTSCEIVTEKEMHNKDKDSNEISHETTEKNTKKTEKKRIYIECDPEFPNLDQVFEVAKYAVLEKTLENLPKEIAVIELQCFKEECDLPFQMSVKLGFSNGVQKKLNYLQFDTSEEACEKYHLYIEDLKEKKFKLRKGIPQEAVHFASEKLKELFFHDAINATCVSKEIRTFVELIWVEALGHLDHILLNPVNSISLNDVSKGEGILLQIRKALDNGETTASLIAMISEFYRIIPHKNGLNFTVNKKLVSNKQDLCQLIRDIVSVCETSMSGSNPPSLAKYHALSCMIEHVSPSSEEFLQVKLQVLEKNHSNSPLEILNIYRVGRLSEGAEFESKLGNVQSLLHASAACNYVGILSRGLLLPKIVVEDHGVERTDIGNLGSGIYFSDSVSTSLKYSTPTETDGSRLLVVCDVALGNCLELHKKDYSLTNAPSGFHSVHGIRKAPGVLADFEDDEFVIYKTSQVKIKYIVQFCTTEDTIKEFCPNVNVAPSEDILSNPSDVLIQTEEIELTDIKPLDEITAGLLDLSGNQIPLKGVYIKGKILDFTAQVVVFQTYTNQSKVPIEAKYVFPLDSTAAVCGFEAFINGKHIIGEVKEKQQAHREYREAISQGHGAYLMDQDSPDVFTVSVGNLPPNATVFIKITYVTELKASYGSVTFEIPGTVAPWQQDKALKENTQDTVEKICVNEGDQEKGAFSLDLSVEMPCTIDDISCTTHSIKMKKTDCKAVVSTTKNSSLDSSGFTLLIDLSERYLPRMWVERHPDKESEACMLVFQPEFDLELEEAVHLNEVIICLDCSNSMNSVLQQAKKIALLALNECFSKSKLNIIKFGSRSEEFCTYSKIGSMNAEAMEKFIKSANSTMGNTDLWKVLNSLSLLSPSKGIRSILLISDGHIQEESRTFQIVKNAVKHTRLFTCGVGPTANRHMLRSLSHYGGGAFEYFDAKSKYNWTNKIEDQFERMDAERCNSVSVKWQQFNAGAPEPMQAPAHIQSLFRTEKVLVYGFVPHCTQASLNFMLNNQELNTMVSTTELQKTTGTILHKLTAKALIRDYEDGILHEKENEHEMKKQMLKSMIIELSKEYSIVTQFTSFVAIERRDVEESEADIPNIQDLLTAEDVDFLPYMTWEKDPDDNIHYAISRKKKKTRKISLEGKFTCNEDVLCDTFGDVLETDKEEEFDNDFDMGFGLFDTSIEEVENYSDAEIFECSSAISHPTSKSESYKPTKPSPLFLVSSESSLAGVTLSAIHPPPPPPAPARLVYHSEALSLESLPPPSAPRSLPPPVPATFVCSDTIPQSSSILQPRAEQTKRRLDQEMIIRLPRKAQQDLSFSETSIEVAQKDGLSCRRVERIGLQYQVAGSPVFEIKSPHSAYTGGFGQSFAANLSSSGLQQASSFGGATPPSFFKPSTGQSPSINTHHLLQGDALCDFPSRFPVHSSLGQPAFGFGSSSGLFGSSASKTVFGSSSGPFGSSAGKTRRMDKAPSSASRFSSDHQFTALRKRTAYFQRANEFPSWSALFLLQTPNNYWDLSPELGTALKINVNYLINIFLIQKGLNSLGPKGREEVLRLIATLLVLQAMRFTQEKGEITFKSLMKLDESSVQNDFYGRLQKVMEWARNVDSQYPAICSRLGLGKDWNSATRQLLGIDPIEANSPLDKIVLSC